MDDEEPQEEFLQGGCDWFKTSYSEYIQEPAQLALHGKLIKMKILRSQPNLLNQKFWEGTHKSFCKNPSVDSNVA